MGTGAGQRWEARLSLTDDPDHDDFADPGKLLASTDATTPSPTFQPYIGDYCHLVALGHEFFGIFSASNFPDRKNFPRGVKYQRHVNWSTHRLFANATKTTTVAPSIDPFFFRYRPDPIHFLQREFFELEASKGRLIAAFEAAEIPPAPRTPQQVAQLQRFLHNLERRADRLREEIRRRRDEFPGSIPEDDND